MSTMTKTALSDCSYPESIAYNIRDDIDATIARLKVVIDEEASLRKALRTLFVKRREEALEQVRLANLHLDLVNEEEAAFCDDLMKAAASANEGSQGSGCIDGVRTGGTAMPTFVPIPTTSLGNHPSLNKVEDICRTTPATPKPLNHGDGYNDTAPPRTPPGPTRSFDVEPLKSPAKSRRGLIDEPPRSPTRSIHAFDLPQSPARSTHAFVDEPPRSPARSTEQPKKAVGTKATDAKKKKGEGKKGNAKDIDTKPTPNVLSSTAKTQKGTVLWPTPAARRAAKAKKPNVLSMPTEDRTGEPFTASFDNNPHDPLESPARSAHGLTDDDKDQTGSLHTPGRYTHGIGYTAAPKSPVRSTRGMLYEQRRAPARSARTFNPTWSPACSIHAFADESTRSPTRSPAGSTRGLDEQEVEREDARSKTSYDSYQYRRPDSCGSKNRAEDRGDPTSMIPTAASGDGSTQDDRVLSSRFSMSTTTASMPPHLRNEWNKSPTEPVPDLKPRQLTDAEMYKLDKVGNFFNFMAPTKKPEQLPATRTPPGRNPFRI